MITFPGRRCRKLVAVRERYIATKRESSTRLAPKTIHCFNYRFTGKFALTQTACHILFFNQEGTHYSGGRLERSTLLEGACSQYSTLNGPFVLPLRFRVSLPLNSLTWYRSNWKVTCRITGYRPKLVRINSRSRRYSSPRKKNVRYEGRIVTTKGEWSTENRFVPQKTIRRHDYRASSS